MFRSRAAAGVGQSVPSDSRNAPTTALHSNRLATILVVDIRDSTPLARSVSEAALSQALGAWFLRTGQIVQRLDSWALRSAPGRG